MLDMFRLGNKVKSLKFDPHSGKDFIDTHGTASHRYRYAHYYNGEGDAALADGWNTNNQPTFRRLERPTEGKVKGLFGSGEGELKRMVANALTLSVLRGQSELLLKLVPVSGFSDPDQLFRDIDADGSGTITIEELRDFLLSDEGGGDGRRRAGTRRRSV